MSWWNAMYPNDEGEYEITFASKDREKAKAVEKVCAAIMDGKVCSPEDVRIVRRATWHTIILEDKNKRESKPKKVVKVILLGAEFKTIFAGECPHCNKPVESTSNICPGCNESLDWSDYIENNP